MLFVIALFAVAPLKKAWQSVWSELLFLQVVQSDSEEAGGDEGAG